MEFKEYQKRAARTLISAPDKEYSNDEIMLTWNTLGLVGEAAEVEDVIQRAFSVYGDKTAELEKELGDTLWYVAALLTRLGVDMERLKESCPDEAVRKQVTSRPIFFTTMKLTINAGAVAEYVKKTVFHQHQFSSEKMFELISDVYFEIAMICASVCIDMGKVMKDNIEKLEIRYPDGYKPADSIARVDENGIK